MQHTLWLLELRQIEVRRILYGAAFQSEGKLYMVLNYLPGGELFYRLKREGRFSVERVRLYGAEIAAGLGALPQCRAVCCMRITRPPPLPPSRASDLAGRVARRSPPQHGHDLSRPQAG